MVIKHKFLFDDQFSFRSSISDSSSDGSSSDSDSSDAQIRRDSVQSVAKLNLRDDIYSNSDSDDENNVSFFLFEDTFRM